MQCNTIPVIPSIAIFVLVKHYIQGDSLFIGSIKCTWKYSPSLSVDKLPFINSQFDEQILEFLMRENTTIWFNNLRQVSFLAAFFAFLHNMYMGPRLEALWKDVTNKQTVYKMIQFRKASNWLTRCCSFFFILTFFSTSVVCQIRSWMVVASESD